MPSARLDIVLAQSHITDYTFCSLLAVQSDIGVHICQRGLLQRQTRAGIAAVQLAAHNLAVQSLQGTRPVHLTTQLPIKGVSFQHASKVSAPELCMCICRASMNPKVQVSFFPYTQMFSAHPQHLLA